MDRDGLYPSSPQIITFVGNYLPRQCGIATFTHDLLEAISAEAQGVHCWAVTGMEFGRRSAPSW